MEYDSKDSDCHFLNFVERPFSFEKLQLNDVFKVFVSQVLFNVLSQLDTRNISLLQKVQVSNFVPCVETFFSVMIRYVFPGARVTFI